MAAARIRRRPSKGGKRMQDDERDAGNLGDGGGHGESGENGGGPGARPRRGEGRFRLSTRFGPRGRRSSVQQRRYHIRQVYDEHGGETRDPHDLYYEQIRRRGDGLYTLNAWPLAPRIAVHPPFVAENPLYRAGAPCWALMLASPDPTLRRALQLRLVGKPFEPLQGPLPRPPEVLEGCAWSDFLEAELCMRGLAQDLRAQGLGILVY